MLAGGPAILAIALAACGVLVAAFAWAPAAVARARRHRGWIVIRRRSRARLVAGTVGQPDQRHLAPNARAVAPGEVPRRGAGGSDRSCAAGGRDRAAGEAGLVLVSDAVRVWLGLTPRQRAPWKQMTEVQPRSTPIAWRASAESCSPSWRRC